MVISKKNSVVIAEDHDIVREGLRRLLESEPDIEVVGEAADGLAALEVAERTRPDVVLMDLSMPQLNGIEATRRITRNALGPKVICLSVHRELKMIAAILRAGASGYLLKNCSSSELTAAIRSVVSGNTYLSPGIAKEVLDGFVRNRPEPAKSVLVMLTDREREILQLIAEGKTAKEVGSRLGISQKTVLAHRQKILEKLSLHTDVELARYALQQGITEL